MCHSNYLYDLFKTLKFLQLTQCRLYQPWLLSDTLFRLFGYHKRQMKASRNINNFLQSIIEEKRKEVQDQRLRNSKTTDCENVKRDFKNVQNKNIKEPILNRKVTDEQYDGMNPINDFKNENKRENVLDKDSDQFNVELLDVDGGLSKTKSFLELLLEIGHSPDEKLTDAEILPELTTIFFAALDTTATSNATTLLLLALHPDILQKVGVTFYIFQVKTPVTNNVSRWLCTPMVLGSYTHVVKNTVI